MKTTGQPAHRTTLSTQGCAPRSAALWPGVWLSGGMLSRLRADEKDRVQMRQNIAYMEPRVARGNGADIVFDSFGAADDPAVLLIMGLGDQMITWHEDFCRLLAAKGFYVIRFDNRDIGLSTRFSGCGVPKIYKIILQKMFGLPARAPYSLSDMAADAVSVLDAAAVRSACVVGASMGGMIAQVMAVEHPDRVSLLVSVISAAELVPGASMLFRFASSALRNMFADRKSRLPFSPSLKALSFVFTDPPEDREGFADYYARLEAGAHRPGICRRLGTNAGVCENPL